MDKPLAQADFKALGLGSGLQGFEPDGRAQQRLHLHQAALATFGVDLASFGQGLEMVKE